MDNERIAKELKGIAKELVSRPSPPDNTEEVFDDDFKEFIKIEFLENGVLHEKNPKVDFKVEWDTVEERLVADITNIYISPVTFDIKDMVKFFFEILENDIEPDKPEVVEYFRQNPKEAEDYLKHWIENLYYDTLQVYIDAENAEEEELGGSEYVPHIVEVDPTVCDADDRVEDVKARFEIKGNEVYVWPEYPTTEDELFEVLTISPERELDGKELREMYEESKADALRD